jgi:hypothetical protein
MNPDSTQETRRAEQQAYFNQSHIDIAVLKVIVETQAKEIAAMTQALRVMGDQLGAMNMLLSEAKGGWRVIAAVAGAASIFGSAISWIILHVPSIAKGP